MSTKLLKLLILSATLLSALASSASATGWSSNGSASGTPFTATAPASKLVLVGTAAGFNCTMTSATGRLFGPTGALSPPAATLTLAFGGCAFGGFTTTATCMTDAVNLMITSYTAPIASSKFGVGVLPICTFTFPGLSGCTLRMVATNGVGSLVANTAYNNTTAVLSLNTAGQQLTGAWSSCGSLFGTPSGSAPMIITNSTGSSLVYTITSVFVPNITA